MQPPIDSQVTIDVRVTHVHEYRLLPSDISIVSLVQILVSLYGLI